MLVNHKRVARVMREDNLLAVQPKDFVTTTDSNHQLEIYLNLARRMKLTGIDQLWVADITYIRLQSEFVYLAVILDGFSRRVVGWKLDRTLTSRLATEPLQNAIESRQPLPGLVHHSDRGIQYASAEYVEILKKHGIVLRQNIIGFEVVDFPGLSGHNRRTMLPVILYCFRALLLLFIGHRAIALENLALRQQLAIYKRGNKRPRLVRHDRWFWILLSRVWEDWRRALVIVHPDTVVRWHRQRLRQYWVELSNGRRKPGRSPTGLQIREVIRTLATENPLWRAPRIHGELLKLGIVVSERTVSRILRTVKRPPSQTWKTFLKNHVGEIFSVDFFTVPTATLRVLYRFLV